ncbi:MAG TPA: extracellular solute-binding protein [Anaerolineaceae bacterium]|nr:extracellular solute-binding protein [Anaerolineaceae bacterium]
MQPQKLALKFIPLLVVLAMVLAACSPAAQPTTDAPATQAPQNTAMPKVDWNTAKSVADGGGMDALIAAAKAEGQLNVITLPRDWCDYGDMMDNFSSKYGIKVNSINPEGGSADEVQAIKDNKDNKGPQAPDVLDIGPAYGPLSKSQNLLAPYKVATWDTIKGTNDPDGYYFVDYSGIMALEVNSDQVKNIPQDIKDLLDPQYKGQVALSGDPRASNQAAQEVYMTAIAMGGTLDNIQPGLDFMKKLNDEGNLLPLIAKSGNIAKGEVAITYEWSWNAYANKENFKGNPNIAVVFPKSVTWGGYYYQAISAYAPHPAAARLWEEYLYSDEGQLTWVKGYCAPARLSDLVARNAISADLSAKLPDPKLLAVAITPNNDQLNAARALIKDKWDSVVANFPTK